MDANNDPRNFTSKAAKKRARKRALKEQDSSQPGEAGGLQNIVPASEEQTAPSVSHTRQVPAEFPAVVTTGNLTHRAKTNIVFGSQQEEEKTAERDKDGVGDEHKKSIDNNDDESKDLSNKNYSSAYDAYVEATNLAKNKWVIAEQQAFHDYLDTLSGKASADFSNLSLDFYRLYEQAASKLVEDAAQKVQTAYAEYLQLASQPQKHILESEKAEVERMNTEIMSSLTQTSLLHGWVNFRISSILQTCDDRVRELMRGNVAESGRNSRSQAAGQEAESRARDSLEQQDRVRVRVKKSGSLRDLSPTTKQEYGIISSKPRLKPEADEFLPIKAEKPPPADKQPSAPKEKITTARAPNTGQKVRRPLPRQNHNLDGGSQASILRSLLDQLGQSFNLMERLCNTIPVTTQTPAQKHHGVDENWIKLLRSGNDNDVEKPTWLPIVDAERRAMRLHLGTRIATYEDPLPERQRITEKNRARRLKQKEKRKGPARSSDTEVSS